MVELDKTELRDFVRQKQLKQNFKQAESALIASVICACLLGYFLYEAVPFDHLVRWGQFMGAVAAVRYLLIYAYRNTNLAPQDVKRWRNAFVVTLGFSGLAWGSATFLLPASVSNVHQAMVVLCITGFVAGAGVGFAGDRRAFAAFGLPAVSLPVANLVATGDPLSQKFAWLIALFFAFLAVSSERSYVTRKKEVYAESERERLTQALKYEKENFEKLARELEARANARTEQLSILNEKLQTEVFERREAEIAAKSRKARFTAAFENAPTGMVIAYQATGEIVKANASACELFGYQANEMTKMRIFSLLCPSERDEGFDLFDGDGRTLERRFLHRRGHIVWGRTSIGNMSGTEESEGLVVIQIQDLSELKSAHNRLSSLGGAFGTAFETTPVPTAIIDTCGRITNVNPRMQSVLSLGYDNIEDLALASLVASDEQASTKLADFFSGRVGHIEADVVLFKGQTNEIDTTISVSRIGEGSSSDAYAVLHIDVSLGAFKHPEKTPEGDTNVVPLERRA